MPNLRLAVRALTRTPFVTAVAVASLALGIGANTAIFSLIHRVLLRPLPVPDPNGLVNLAAPGPKQGSTSCNAAGDCDVIFSYPMYRDLETRQTGLASLAAHRSFSANVAYNGQTLDGQGMLVSGSYFPTLGVTPALGRLLGPADDQVIGGHPVAVLSHNYWETRLGADPGVIGQTLVVNGQTMSIVGVAAKGFDGTTLGLRPRVFVPISMRGVMSPGFSGFENRKSYWVYVFGRLQEGTPMGTAAARINAVYRPIIADVEVPLQQDLTAERLAGFTAKEVVLTSGAQGQNNIQSGARLPLVILLAITAIVLLIACTNVANLLLARVAVRSNEMAVRASLGAGRGQLIGQLLLESSLLAVIAGVVSLFVANLTMRLIMTFLPPEATAVVDLKLNPSVLGFAGLLSLATSLVFGLVPAIQATRFDLISVIKAGTAKASGGRTASRFRAGLVTAQIALSMALLCSAGLFVRSLVNVSRVQLGIQTENLITFTLSPQLNGYPAARSGLFFRRVEEELRGLPGVTGVAAAMVQVLSGSSWSTDVQVEGLHVTPESDDNSQYNVVGPTFFATLGMAVLVGREFTAADEAGGPRVAIVNEAFAKKFKLGRNPVGKRMTDGGPALDMEIVGLVKDAAYRDVKDPAPPLFFAPYRQDTTLGSLSFYVRTAAAPGAVLEAIPAAIARLDANLPVAELQTVPQQIKENVFLDRMLTTFSAAFALLATLLAAVGLYGVLAYAVAQRTREIGVRMALGADGARVRGMVLRQVGVMTAIGSAFGIAAAVGIGRAARSVLFGLTAIDPWAFLGAAVVLAGVALMAGYLPARRASRVHPMQALRYE